MRALAAAGLLCACAAPRAGRGTGLPPGTLPVPLVRQAASYSCGAAATAAVLRYWNVFEGGESALYARLETTEKDGTDPRAMLRVVREFGLQAELGEGMDITELRRRLGRGETVILDIQAWAEDDPTPGDYSDNWEDGHYVVLVGLDEVNAYVMDPSVSAAYGWFPLAELPVRWHDYEDRGGVVWRNQGLGIAVSGGQSLTAVPAPLERVR